MGKVAVDAVAAERDPCGVRAAPGQPPRAWRPPTSPGTRSTPWLIDPATGVAALIAAPTPGGWGVLAGLAVNNAIESYGARLDGLNRYWFQNFPNPGGLPTVGNQAFSLTSRSAPGAPTLSVFALSTGRGSTQLFGAEILVDLNNSFVATLPGATSTAIPLPIPNDPSLIGTVFTAQTVHFEGGPVLVLKASRGLTFTIQGEPRPRVMVAPATEFCSVDVRELR